MIRNFYRKSLYVLIFTVALSIFMTGLSGCMKEEVKSDDTLIPYRANDDIEIGLEKTSDAVALISGNQKAEFRENENGKYVLTTYVLKGGTWTPFFDSKKPLIQGESFSAEPDEFEVLADEKDLKSVLLKGKHPTLGYDFDILVEAMQGSPLIKFKITNHFTQNIELKDYEPIMMLWRNGKADDRVSINQEVPAYQTVDDTKVWNSGFPSSYFYTSGMESAIYFNMTPMTWYSMKNGIRRFRVSQVRTIEREGLTGTGLDLRVSNPGKKIAEGDMVTEFYLYGNSRNDVPTKLDALDVAVDAFSYCLAASVEWPVNYVDDTLSYEFYAGKIIEGLMAEDFSYQWHPAKAGVWNDAPMFPDRTITEILHRPGYIPGTDYKGNNKQTEFFGDWNCNNNTVLPWILYERIHNNSAGYSLLQRVTEGLLAYFDKTASIYRSFDTHPGYEGTGLEFTFQNFFMQQGALWASSFTRNDDFDPALGGKFLQAMTGLKTLADKTGYKMPQLVDVTRMTPANSMDEKHLGVTYDVWTGCIYSYNMCLAYDITGEQKYLDEAEKSIKILFNGLEFYVNSLKEKLYTDPYEFPVNEVSSAPWGVAAAQWLFRITGNEEYLEYSEAIRNMTLRMMKWYESALKDDPIDQSLGGIAFFHAFSNTDTTCPWESIMTYMPMLMELKNDTIEPSQVLLKTFNLFRINGFSLSGASWEPDIIPSAKVYQSAITAYYMPEDYYSAETPTIPGANGANSYMSNCLMYSYILFEAYAKADDPDIMVLNLDITDAGQDMANGIERNFMVLNPTSEKSKFKIDFKDLNTSADYLVTTNTDDGKEIAKTISGSDLMNKGITNELSSMEYLRINIKLDDLALTSEYLMMKEAQYSLIKAYGALQASGDEGITEIWEENKSSYLQALEFYNSERYAECIELIDSFYTQYE